MVKLSPFAARGLLKKMVLSARTSDFSDASGEAGSESEKYMSDIQLGCLIYGNEIFELVPTGICCNLRNFMDFL